MIYKKKTTNKIIKFTDKSNILSALPEFLEKETEYHCLSVGQYNLIDIIRHVLNTTKTANIDLTVWTAADASLKKASDFVLAGDISKMRWIIDPSFKSRQPLYVKTLENRFSKDCIRTIPTHAKFILVYNENYNFIIQTSMNLNQNKRLESFTVIENKELVSFYKDFFDSAFKISIDENYKSQNISIVKKLIPKQESLFDFNDDIDLGF